MNKRHLQLAVAAGLVLSLAGTSNATIIGFANSFGNNTTLPGDIGSFATADMGGVTVMNGATPNIGLTWDDSWDYHHASFFDVVEDHTMGGAWDTDGGPDIAQTDVTTQSVVFAVDAGSALVLNQFDFGLTRESLDQGNTWTISLTDSSNATVWTDTIHLLNTGSGDVRTLAPNFVGVDGEDYTLTFNFDSEDAGQTYGPGRNALDNLSFNQVPEPATMALLAFGGLMLVRRRQ